MSNGDFHLLRSRILGKKRSVRNYPPKNRAKVWSSKSDRVVGGLASIVYDLIFYCCIHESLKKEHENDKGAPKYSGLVHLALLNFQ